jgi:RES domain-containing protein
VPSPDIDLSTLPSQSGSGSRTRLDLVEHLESSLRKLTGSDADLAEILRDIGGLDDPYREVADRRFRPLADGTYYSGRYNASDFPAFYLAADQSTATKEAAHARLQEAMKHKQPITLELTDWEVRGVERSLLSFATSHSELTGEDYPYCQRIGRQANGGAAQLLTVPSARLSGSWNCVVFVRSVVRSLGPNGTKVLLQFNSGTGEVEILP